MKCTLTGRCGSCGEHHDLRPGSIGCPPHEVRTTGVEWFRVYIEELESLVEGLQGTIQAAENVLSEYGAQGPALHDRVFWLGRQLEAAERGK